MRRPVRRLREFSFSAGRRDASFGIAMEPRNRTKISLCLVGPRVVSLNKVPALLESEVDEIRLGGACELQSPADLELAA